jgi:type I restriction-modification system DNA methylase subunit
MDYIKEFNCKLQALGRSKSIETVFKDFLTLSTCSLAQPFYRSPDLEQKYMETINNYSKEQAEEFSQLLALLVSALEEKHQDFLGQIFSLNGFGNSSKGQFFTPYHISKFMAEINFTDIEKHFEKSDFITLGEPCSGSGGMVIAAAEVLKEKGYNYQHQLYVEAVDIDEVCFKMTYVQLALLGIPAKVVRGDSIAMRYYEVIYTPFYFIGNFRLRLETAKKEVVCNEPKGETAGQLTLSNFL